MGNIVLNAAGLFAMIFLGYFLKQLKVLSKADGSILSKIILNVTLPAAIILNLASMQVKVSALSLIVIALIITIVQILFAFFLTKKESSTLQQFAMYCGSGFNIGNFAIPFAQSFYPLGIPLISLFDMGNSIMLAGGTTIFIEFLIGKRTTFEPGKIFLNLLRSPTFTIYLVMLIIRSADWRILEAALALVQPIGIANTFFVHVYDWLIFGFPLTEAHYANGNQNFKLALRTGLCAVCGFLCFTNPSFIKASSLFVSVCSGFPCSVSLIP